MENLDAKIEEHIEEKVGELVDEHRKEQEELEKWTNYEKWKTGIESRQAELALLLEKNRAEAEAAHGKLMEELAEREREHLAAWEAWTQQWEETPEEILVEETPEEPEAPAETAEPEVAPVESEVRPRYRLV